MKELTERQLEAVNIACAELDGWERHKAWIPDYTQDLNAVHRLEESLPKELGTPSLYMANLADAVGYGAHVASSDPRYDDFAWACMHATALQRCIALLMTLHPEKWKEIEAMEEKV